MNEEICKYRKKKESNISKSKKKSKHKHIYKECIVNRKYHSFGKDFIRPELASYCTICGKIGENIEKRAYGEKETNFIRAYTKEEIYDKNKDLEIFEANVCDRYIRKVEE